LDHLCCCSQVGGDKRTARSQVELIPIARKSDAPIAHLFGGDADEVAGRVLVEAAGPPGVLRTVQFVRASRMEGWTSSRPSLLRRAGGGPRRRVYSTTPFPLCPRGATDE